MEEFCGAYLVSKKRQIYNTVTVDLIFCLEKEIYVI